MKSTIFMIFAMICFAVSIVLCFGSLAFAEPTGSVLALIGAGLCSSGWVLLLIVKFINKISGD